MSALINGRPLHFVFKIGNRARNAHFFRDVLGMRVLRHEEFKDGCDAQCNGPYDNRWSKTMIGYGPEDTHFVIELTYNYGVQEYRLGNEFGGITIRSAAVLQRARQHSWAMSATPDGQRTVLLSPDGYRFEVIDEAEVDGRDPVERTTLRCLGVARTAEYWSGVLAMRVVEQTEKRVTLAYENGCQLAFEEIADPIDRGTAYGRIAFAVPLAVQEAIDKRVGDVNGTVLTPLITLDTPGKATVRVIILADPDGHEICFVDEEGFTQLSQFDAAGDAELDKFIKKDPFQK